MRTHRRKVLCEKIVQKYHKINPGKNGCEYLSCEIYMIKGQLLPKSNRNNSNHVKSSITSVFAFVCVLNLNGHMMKIIFYFPNYTTFAVQKWPKLHDWLKQEENLLRGSHLKYRYAAPTCQIDYIACKVQLEDVLPSYLRLQSKAFPCCNVFRSLGGSRYPK